MKKIIWKYFVNEDEKKSMQMDDKNYIIINPVIAEIKKQIENWKKVKEEKAKTVTLVDDKLSKHVAEMVERLTGFLEELSKLLRIANDKEIYIATHKVFNTLFYLRAFIVAMNPINNTHFASADFADGLNNLGQYLLTSNKKVYIEAIEKMAEEIAKIPIYMLLHSSIFSAEYIENFTKQAENMLAECKLKVIKDEKEFATIKNTY